MARSETTGGQEAYRSVNPAGYTQVTLTGSTVAVLTPPALNIVRVLIRASYGAARFRDDHIDPTSTVGMPVLQDEAFIHDSGFSDLRFVRDTTAVPNVVLDVNWYN